MQEANMRPELKPRVMMVWADFQMTIVDRTTDQWRKRLQACAKAKGQHYEQLLYFVLPLIFYCLH